MKTPWWVWLCPQLPINSQLGLPWELPNSLLWILLWEDTFEWSLKTLRWQLLPPLLALPVWWDVDLSKQQIQLLHVPCSFWLSVPTIVFSTHMTFWGSSLVFSLTRALLFHDKFCIIKPPPPFHHTLNCSLVFHSWLLSISLIAFRERFTWPTFLVNGLVRFWFSSDINSHEGQKKKEGKKGSAFSSSFKV